MDTLLGLPILWAQATPDQDVLPVLALQRWTSSLTLSAPEATPRPIGLWAWLLGLAVLLILATIAQGPRRALGQFFDLAGHLQLIRSSLTRLRRAGRLVVAVLGAMVLAWTGMQFDGFNRISGQASLLLLLRNKTPTEVALEQGTLAALMPLRDLLGLADLLLLLLAAMVVVFKYSADRWPSIGPEEDQESLPRPPTGWATLCWGAMGIYGLYRITAIVVVPSGGLPLGGCLLVESLAVPALMALADGILLAWVLVELARADDEAGDVEGIDVRRTLLLVPGATLACLLALPARYTATAGYLALDYLPDTVARMVLVPLIFGWGLTWLQGTALIFAGLPGAVARSDGTWGGALRVYGRLLRFEGGRMVALLLLGGLAAGALAGSAYVIVLSLPSQPWVLTAADAYSHYATLPIGLVILSALVQLARLGDRPPVAEPGHLGDLP
ncbi:hypothetical protein BH23PLA1_BH23PLA1_17180 [soil metagenome]